MASGSAGPEHPIPTRRSRYRYFFHVKHHDGSDSAQWLPEMSREEEFSVFDDADFFDLSDDSGRALYGLRRSATGKVLELGTRGQLVAEFPSPSSGNAWHGYPLWPLLRFPSRMGKRIKKRRPAKEVFSKMEKAKLIDGRDRKRLEKGKHL